MKKISFNIILILIAIICGFLSGLIGVFMLTSGSIPFFSDFEISPKDADRQIVIDQPRNVIVSQDVQIKQMENNLLPALVNVYQSGKNPTQGFANSQILGQGVVLTTDGWVLLPQKAISNPSLQYEAVGYQNKQYKLTNFIQDKTTGLAFAKMDAKNLPVATIGKSKEAVLGQMVAVISQRKNLEIANVVSIGYSFKTEKDLVQFSDSFGKRLILNIDLDQSYNGAVVSNLKGEVIGVVNDGKVVMSDYFNKTIGEVLASKKIVRPELGVSYIDLANTEGVISLGAQGAYVMDVAKTSPIFGKIKAGDTIKKINDFELNSYVSLSEAINNYTTGNKIEILYSRGGKDTSANVVLK